jgi:hypothetical protein
MPSRAKVTERLVIDAKKAGIRVVDRRGPLGTIPPLRVRSCPTATCSPARI